MTRHFVPCQLAGLGVAAAALVSIAPFRVIADEGDPPCEAFCEAVFPDDFQGSFTGELGEETKRCIKEARKAGPASFCARCQADPAQVCGPATFAVCCDPASSFCCESADGPSCHAACTNGHLPDPAGCGCVCPPATEECGGSCVAACPSGRVLDPASCSCVCAPGTVECGGSCVPACPSGRVPDPVSCSCVCAPGTEECAGTCVPTGQCAPAACQQGTDPETGAVYVVCRADASTAWVSSSGGGQYHADQICQLLGYSTFVLFGGTCGNVCGHCEGATSCQAPGSEVYDSQGTCGADQHGRILCVTVNWECVK